MWQVAHEFTVARGVESDGRSHDFQRSRVHREQVKTYVPLRVEGKRNVLRQACADLGILLFYGCCSGSWVNSRVCQRHPTQPSPTRTPTIMRSVPKMLCAKTPSVLGTRPA